ncbi:MAG: hypothetical protein KF752_16585 [Pirellulaceae bacterium]|nr:hypothetical protein [Pirellulaceae bacterium]
MAYCARRLPNDCKILGNDNHQQSLLLGDMARCLAVAEDRYWQWLFQLAPDCSNWHDLSQRLIMRCLSPHERTTGQATRLAACLIGAERAFANEHPDFGTTIKFRVRPLQEQWEAYGPGLLSQIQPVVGPQVLEERAEVLLVQPIVGGYGLAHLNTNRCHIEAVLTNADPQLTETLRLAWLLSQLGLERPPYSDHINAHRLPMIAALSMLPPTLHAAEQLGIGQLSAIWLQRAIAQWKLPTAGISENSLAEVLLVWWETVNDHQTSWCTAMTGLDRMVLSQE